MSQAQPFQPNLHPERDEGIPAADPGPGAPEPAPGVGIGGEEPSRSEGSRAEPSTAGLDDERLEEAGEEDTVFRTPDPGGR